MRKLTKSTTVASKRIAPWQVPHLQADDRCDRDHRVLHGVAIDDPATEYSLRPSGPNVVLPHLAVEHLEEPAEVLNVKWIVEPELGAHLSVGNLVANEIGSQNRHRRVAWEKIEQGKCDDAHDQNDRDYHQQTPQNVLPHTVFTVQSRTTY